MQKDRALQAIGEFVLDGESLLSRIAERADHLPATNPLFAVRRASLCFAIMHPPAGDNVAIAAIGNLYHAGKKVAFQPQQ